MGTQRYTIRTGTTPTATQVIRAGEGPHLIWNRDLVNSVFLGDTNTLRLGDEGLVEIDPNGSIAVDGETDKFVISAVNGVQVDTILGGMSNFRGLSIAEGSLVLPSLHSQGYVPGFTGWTINKDDSAEFNNLTVRGTFIGNNYKITSAGEFFYAGTPALGNLSISHVPGTVNVSDGLGNVALPGDTIYQTPIALNTIAFNIQQGIITWYLWNGASWGFGPSIDWTLANNFIEFLGAPIRSISGTRANPTLISTDSWTNFSAFGAGFQAGGFAPQQCLMPAGPNNAGCVKLRGQVIANAATAANALMVTAIGGPTQDMAWTTPTNASGYVPPARVVTVNTAAQVRLQPAASNTNFVLLDGIEIPLG